MQTTRIDVEKIPDAQMRVLASTLLDTIRQVVDTPEFTREFEAWKKARS